MMIPITGAQHSTSFEACAASITFYRISSWSKVTPPWITRKGILEIISPQQRESLQQTEENTSLHIWVDEEFLFSHHNSSCSHLESFSEIIANVFKK